MGTEVRVRTVQPADKGTRTVAQLGGTGVVPAVGLAAVVGLLATAVLLGVVWATSRETDDRAWAITAGAYQPLLDQVQAGTAPAAVACAA